MTIKVRQLHPIFVGEVSAVDLAADLPRPSPLRS